MPIEEKVINSALAEALVESQGVHTVAEQNHPARGSERCDVMVRLKRGGSHFTDVECKIGRFPDCPI